MVTGLQLLTIAAADNDPVADVNQRLRKSRSRSNDGSLIGGWDNKCATVTCFRHVLRGTTLGHLSAIFWDFSVHCVSDGSKIA